MTVLEGAVGDVCRGAGRLVILLSMKIQIKVVMCYSNHELTNRTMTNFIIFVTDLFTRRVEQLRV